MIVSNALVKVGHRQEPHKNTPVIQFTGVFAFAPRPLARPTVANYLDAAVWIACLGSNTLQLAVMGGKPGGPAGEFP